MESLVDPGGKPRARTCDIGEPRNLDEHEASTSVEETHTTEWKKSEWTNEKHSLYLKSMETSFVNQLYDSLDSFGWNSHNKCSSNPKISKQKNSSSGQFKVFRDGSWTKIDVRRDEPRQLYRKKDEAGVFLASPWIKHYRSCRHHNETPLNLQEQTPPPAPMNVYPGSQLTLHQQSIDSITEVTDQNFVDDELGAKTSRRMQSTKRIKTSLASDSSNDQVVPFGKHPVSGDDAQDMQVTENQ